MKKKGEREKNREMGKVEKEAIYILHDIIMRFIDINFCITSVSAVCF